METKLYSDGYFMKEALKEARKAFDIDEVPVGAVVVWNNRIIARAHNLTETLTDVTAHAEMQAFTAAANSIGGKFLDECSLFVTVEPCLMCAGAAYWARLGKLVYGTSDPERGYSHINKMILHPKTIVVSGILEDECVSLMKTFFGKKRE